MCAVRHSQVPQNHSLIKELKLCVRSFLLPLSLLRLWASLLAVKPLTRLAKPPTQWLLTPKQTLTPLLKLLPKPLTRPLKLLPKLLTLLKALLKKQPLTQKLLPSNRTAKSIFRFSKGGAERCRPFRLSATFA